MTSGNPETFHSAEQEISELERVGNSGDLKQMLDYAEKKYHFSPEELASLGSGLGQALKNESWKDKESKTMADFYEKSMIKTLEFRKLNKEFERPSSEPSGQKLAVTDQDIENVLGELGG